MTNLETLSEKIAKVLCETEEYKTYHELLVQLKSDPELFRRVSELRDKNYSRQISGNEDIIDLMDSLTNEYEDVINIGLVEDFLQAEAAFCRMIRHLGTSVVQELEFN